MNHIQPKTLSLKQAQSFVENGNHIGAYFITEEVADYLDSLNLGNRAVSDSKQESLIREVGRGGFRLSWDCLATSAETPPRLVNGQKRVKTVKATKTPLPFVCMFGVTLESVIVSDQGQSRSFADLSAMRDGTPKDEGSVNQSIVRLLVRILCGDLTSLTNSEKTLVEKLVKSDILALRSLRNPDNKRVERAISSGAVMAPFVAARSINPEIIDQAWVALSVDNPGFPCITTLRKEIDAQFGKKFGEPGQKRLFCLTSNALQQVLTGKPKILRADEAGLRYLQSNRASLMSAVAEIINPNAKAD